jgi:hypothetical protein
MGEEGEQGERPGPDQGKDPLEVLEREGSEDGLAVTARILPENLRVYRLLVAASMSKGLSDEDVNTSLINAGLVAWVQRIGFELEELERATQGTSGGPPP